ncbi:MAG: methyltransferase domain-containing protein [Candidatus Aminicenantes bacterium]|nr:methyltransferase domain-containing protein [Candidatus Aminicenantes bacterium]
MERDEYRRHFELEESHWWFRSRRALVFRLIRARVRAFLPPSPRILDAGCGTGINLARLGDFGRAFGCDIAAEALSFSRERGLLRLARADANRLPFLDERFDLVTFFDVLYHRDITDDTATLRDTVRILRPGGFCLITDSALEKLRGPHDEAHHGARRYDKAGLRAKLEAAGFEVVHLTYFFMTTYPAVSLRRRLERRQAARRPQLAAQSDLSFNPRWLDAAMSGILKLEAGLAARRTLPVGSSIVALARKSAGRVSLS